MNEGLARSILKIISLATVLVGGILTLRTLVTLLGIRGGLDAAFSTFGEAVDTDSLRAGFEGTIVIAQALTIVWGLVLYALSPRLARHVVK